MGHPLGQCARWLARRRHDGRLRGLFYDQETLDGRSIMVRFTFSRMQPRSFGIEQAFSPDGGVTWETNWISDFTKQ